MDQNAHVQQVVNVHAGTAPIHIHFIGDVDHPMAQNLISMLEGAGYAVSDNQNISRAVTFARIDAGYKQWPVDVYRHNLSHPWIVGPVQTRSTAQDLADFLVVFDPKTVNDGLEAGLALGWGAAVLLFLPPGPGERHECLALFEPEDVVISEEEAMEWVEHHIAMRDRHQAATQSYAFGVSFEDSPEAPALASDVEAYE